MKLQTSNSNSRRQIEVCVLAGGLSSRMGRDKARLRLQGRTLLGWVRRVGAEMGLPVRVIRADLVQRCGPLGGIYTALKTTRAGAVLFLACDMPFVSAAMMRRLLRRPGAVFTRHDGLAGFPFLLRREALGLVEKQLAAKEFSLQALAREGGGVFMVVPKAERWRLMNINRPEDWSAAREIILQRYKRRGK